MHIHLERSSLLPASLLQSCGWSFILWSLLIVAGAILGSQLYRRAFPAPVPSIFRRKASPIVEKGVVDAKSPPAPRSFLNNFSLRSLPITLTVPQRPLNPGVGLRVSSTKVTPTALGLAQLRRSPPSSPKGPQPVSMAKIIMSRHTFRKPSAASPRQATPPLPRRPPPVSLFPRSRSPSPEDTERGEGAPSPETASKSEPSTIEHCIV